MATILFWYDFDQKAAEKEFLRAIELNPSYDEAHDFYGWYLVSHKRFDQSSAEHRRALDLSPLDPVDHVVFAQSLYYSRRYDEAADELRTTLLVDPKSWLGHELLGWVYEAKGDMKQSLAEIKRAADLEQIISEPLAALGRAYALQGDRRAAGEILQKLNQLAARQHVPPYNFALLYAGLGEDERAIAEIRKAYEERSWWITLLGLDPKLDRLRSDPRVQQILRQAGIP
jgi:tetratricopeptide (TPR) repeat protein